MLDKGTLEPEPLADDVEGAELHVTLVLEYGTASLQLDEWLYDVARRPSHTGSA
jgi:hypothetical protein